MTDPYRTSAPKPPPVVLVACVIMHAASVALAKVPK